MTGVHSKSPRLNVGSTVKMLQFKPAGGAQNRTRSLSCLSVHATTEGSGVALMSQMNGSSVLAFCIMMNNSSQSWPSVNCKCLFTFDTCVSPLGTCPGADAPMTPPTLLDTRATTSFGPVLEPSFLMSFNVLGQDRMACWISNCHVVIHNILWLNTRRDIVGQHTKVVRVTVAIYTLNENNISVIRKC